MEKFIDSLSRQGKKFKDQLKGKRHKRDREGANTAGERDDSSGSLLRPESRVAVGSHDAEGSRISIDVPQVRSRDQSPQPKPVPTGGTDDDDFQRRGANVDEKDVSPGHSLLDPDVGAAVGSGPSRKAEQAESSPSVPSIAYSGKPDGT